MLSIRIRAFALALLAAAIPAFAYDPPPGGSLLPILSSAQALSSGQSVTFTDAPWADRLNPAASAAQERPVLDAGYVALTDFGAEGWGSALDLGLSLPVPYAVWGAGLRLVSTPTSMSSLPLGTLVEMRGTIAKQLYPDLAVGANLNLALGSRSGSFGWGAGLDLGMQHRLGQFFWGLTLSGIGKAYTIPATGILGGNATGFPPPFTLNAGARVLVLDDEELKAGLGLDLSAPSFQDLALNLWGNLDWRGIIELRLGWDFDLREAIAKKSRSLIPSIGIVATIPIIRASDDSFISKQGWDSSELKPVLSFAPVFGGVMAIGAGASMTLGLIDDKPPQIMTSFSSTASGPVFASPYTESAKTGVVIPVSISDERLIVAYSFTVRDESGKAVRTVELKTPEPTQGGAAGAWERLTHVKQGVPLPDRFEWTGITDTGAFVPDGNYSASIETIDENGNRGVAGPFPIVIDRTAPSAAISVAEDPPIFSPDGDGNKDGIRVTLSGSVEDSWKGQILDSAGKVVKSVDFKNDAPSEFEWDGRGADGAIVPDGIYSFALAATDKAGNSVAKRFDNIVVNTQQAPVNLIIDLAAFSPNGDGVKDAVSLFTSVPVKAGLVGWKLAVLDKDGRETWAVSGADGASLKDRFSFDARDPYGATLPEGQYQAVLSLDYLNGHRPKAASPFFALDVTAPSGAVSADRPAFNPAGGEGQDRVEFSQRGRKDARWTGEVIGPDGSVVRTWSFSPLPDASVPWDGSGDSGQIVPDGVYSYRLKAMDGAGNSFLSPPVVVAVDTAKKAIDLRADQKSFSPLPASARNRVTFSAKVQGNERVRSYELSILPLSAAGGAESGAVRAWKDNKGVPESFVWDGASANGSRAPEGRYVARLAVSYINGDSADALSPTVLLDTVPPSAKISVSPLLFSPTESSSARSVTFSQTSIPGDDWEGRLYGPDGELVRSYSWKGQLGDFGWNGTDEAGNYVTDGSYRYEVASTDAAGNKGAAMIPAIVVDKRPVQVFLTASEAGISPNDDGFKDEVAFNLIVKLREGIRSWRLAIVDAAGAERSVFGGENNEVPSRVVWAGRDLTGAVVPGEVYATFAVEYMKGEKAEARTNKILVDIAAPRVSARLSPELFSPDGDGSSDELSISLSSAAASGIVEWKLEIREQPLADGVAGSLLPPARLFKSWSGSGSPAKLIDWDGRSEKGELVESATDYPYSFTAIDALGNASRFEGRISVDVLVIHEGDRLKIKLPSFAFRPYAADLKDLDSATTTKNEATIRRVAQVLAKYKEYRVSVEGHENNQGKIEGASAIKIADEEEKDLLPLTTSRAELVKTLLADAGFDAKRLSAKGFGSSAPIVDYKDAQNRWKNRRIELVLVRNPTAQ